MTFKESATLYSQIEFNANDIGMRLEKGKIFFRYGNYMDRYIDDGEGNIYKIKDNETFSQKWMPMKIDENKIEPIFENNGSIYSKSCGKVDYETGEITLWLRENKVWWEQEEETTKEEEREYTRQEYINTMGEEGVMLYDFTYGDKEEKEQAINEVIKNIE